MMTRDKPELQECDEEQVRMMKENCIVVDGNDNIIGSDSKVNCHLGEGRLHRAFSVLLFNSSGELLIQKRAANKITFPSIWANSCCSHPLYTDNEMDGIEGTKRAAKRKMEQELGIGKDVIDSNQLCFITKMHYKARDDEKWVEHEIDYIFAINCDVETNSNPNEIEEMRYVTEEELQDLFDSGKKIGPWFKLIKENFLNDIWNTLDDLNKATDGKLHKMDECR